MSLAHPVRPLELGRVIARTVFVLGRAWMVIVPIALLFEWLPNAAQGYLMMTLGERYGGGPYGQAGLAMAWWLLFPLGDMAVVVAAIAVLNGKRVGVPGALIGALALFPAAVGLDVLQNLVQLAEPWLLAGRQSESTQLASTLIEIVYGLASAALLLPSLGVAAQEREGLRRALVRTAAVTEGNRLRVAALAGLFLFLQLVVVQLLQWLIVGLVGVSNPLGLTLSYLPHTLVFCFASTAQAALYWELAAIRDGAAPGEVDAIFS